MENYDFEKLVRFALANPTRILFSLPEWEVEYLWVWLVRFLNLSQPTQDFSRAFTYQTLLKHWNTLDAALSD
jgi:hypothetical protein